MSALQIVIGFFAGIFVTALFMELRHRVKSLDERVKRLEDATPNMNYPSGAASLFSVAARDLTPEPIPNEKWSVTCPYCFSENVEEVDHEHGICFCRNCQTNFDRPVNGSETQ